MDIMSYIVESALILVPCLFVLGLIIKAIPNIPNWIIPFVLLVVGVLGACGILGFSIPSALQGILCTGAAVYVHQLIKQGTEGLKSKPPDAKT